jgi:hypothetical protein
MTPPQLEKTGRINKLEKGHLPDMASKLPDEHELRRWNRESQKAFWRQRKAYWSRLKLSELQKACRKRDLYPGGDIAYVRDRLARYECCRKTLTASETRKEEEDVEPPDREDREDREPSYDALVQDGYGEVVKVRKTPSWPRSWANFSLLELYSHWNAPNNMHLLGQPNTFLAQGLVQGPACTAWPQGAEGQAKGRSKAGHCHRG